MWRFFKFGDLSIRTKIVGASLLLVLVPLGVVSFLSMERFDSALRKAAEQDLEHLVKNIYSMCSLQREMVDKELDHRLRVAKILLLGKASSVEMGKGDTFSVPAEVREGVTWPEIPRWTGQGKPIHVDEDLVEWISEVVGGWWALFHLMEDQSLLSVATNFRSWGQERDKGATLSPDTEVAISIAAGRTFRGRTKFSEEWFIGAYEPVKDPEGKVVGAVGALVKEPIDSIRRQVKSIRVGQTGYAYIMDGQGELRVHPAKEGEKILDAQDSNGFHYIKAMIQTARTMPPGHVATIRYPWMNPELGERVPRQKVTKYAYFAPWDWIIAAGTYEEEIYAALYETEKFILAVIVLSLPLVLVLTLALSQVLSRRIEELTQVTARMLDGDLSQRVEVKTRDEVGLLALSFNRMADQIQQYTSRLQNMVEERTRELAESRESYRQLSAFLNSILESATQYAIIALDLGGGIMEFNKGAEELFGWKKEEVVGRKNISITIPEEESRKGIQKRIAARIKEEGICEIEMDRVKKDGCSFPAHSVITAMKNANGLVTGFVEIVRDLTKTRLLERELRETKEFLENVMASSVDGIVTTDLKGYITFLNKGMEEMLGYSREELVGIHISSLYVRGIQEAREIMSLLYQRQRVQSYEMGIRAKDGRVLTILTSASLLKDGEGRPIGTVGIFKDVTEKKALEAKLKETQAHLVETSKMRALGELVAGVAHELNNPLMASQAMVHVLQNDLKGDESSSRRLELIKRCNERIARIVDHLREFSRQSKPELKPMDLREPIENALLITGQQLLDHQIHLSKELLDGLPKVMGDSNQLEQVFLNLISNARDALDEIENHKELTIKTYSEERDGKIWVVASVKDTGPGIPPEIMEKVIEPFFTTKPVGRGTGLGLSLCFKIVEDHGGLLELISQLGHGTEARVLLPAVEKEECDEQKGADSRR